MYIYMQIKTPRLSIRFKFNLILYISIFKLKPTPLRWFVVFFDRQVIDNEQLKVIQNNCCCNPEFQEFLGFSVC